MPEDSVSIYCQLLKRKSFDLGSAGRCWEGTHGPCQKHKAQNKRKFSWIINLLTDLDQTKVQMFLVYTTNKKRTENNRELS
jgi:hypothetical protein